MVNIAAYEQLQEWCAAHNALLVAVSKLKPQAAIMALYDLGHRDFGENYVQEFVDKQQSLPTDIRWHFIGHLQRNKVKQILGKTHLIHGVDSERLLAEINKQSEKAGIKTAVLLQIHIATESTKFGLDASEFHALMQDYKSGKYSSVILNGLMGMASFSDDESLLRQEFSALQQLFLQYKSAEFSVLSAGMSGDYVLAQSYGSNVIRIGSTLFGAREKPAPAH